MRLAAFLVILVLCASAQAFVVAYDDAADPVYTPGNYHGLNGGFGFGPFTTNGFPVGGNPALQAYVSTSTLNGPGGPNIDTAGRAWGNNAQPPGNTFLARRSLLNDLTVGGTYSVSYDNGDVDGQETISFGLNNNNICQFYFSGSVISGNYQFRDVLSNTTIDTGILQTFGGVRLTLTRNTASTYSFQAVRLSDSLTYTFPAAPYDTIAIPGIRTINVSNADGGNGPGHAMFINAMEATSLVPEPGSIAITILLCQVALKRLRRSSHRDAGV